MEKLFISGDNIYRIDGRKTIFRPNGSFQEAYTMSCVYRKGPEEFEEITLGYIVHNNLHKNKSSIITTGEQFYRCQTSHQAYINNGKLKNINHLWNIEENVDNPANNIIGIEVSYCVKIAKQYDCTGTTDKKDFPCRYYKVDITASPRFPAFFILQTAASAEKLEVGSVIKGKAYLKKASLIVSENTIEENNEQGTELIILNIPWEGDVYWKDGEVIKIHGWENQSN